MDNDDTKKESNLEVMSIIHKQNQSTNQILNDPFGFIKLNFKIILFFIILLLVFISEIFWRMPLFNKTLTDVPSFQSNGSEATDNYFHFMSQLGTEVAIAPIFLLVYLFYPLNISYSLFSCFIYATYFTNLFKIIYSQERPYWASNSIKALECEGGFGNPSGHSFMAMSLYLSIAFILSHKTKRLNFDNPTLKLVLSIFIYSFFIWIALSIIISRVYLGQHSINQVVFGGILGILNFYYVFICLDYVSQTDEEFIDSFVSFKRNICYISAYIILLILVILLYFVDRVDLSSEKWINLINTLNSKCPYDGRTYKRLYENALYGSVPIVSIIVSHLSLWLLCYVHRFKRTFFGKNECVVNDYTVINFNSVSIIRLVIFILMSCIIIGPFAGFMGISGLSSFPIVIIFKFGVPCLAIGMLYGINIIAFFRWGLENSNLKQL